MFGSQGMKGRSKSLFYFYASNFGLHDRDQVTYLVDTQVLGMGISFLY